MTFRAQSHRGAVVAWLAVLASLVAAVLGAGAPASAQEPPGESPLAVLPMTLMITHDGEVNSLAQDTLGGLTILVGGVECETLTFEDAEPAPVRIETLLGEDDQPDACHAPGGTVTFKRGDGVPLFVSAVFEPGGVYELTNFVPGPTTSGPSITGDLPSGGGVALVHWSGGTIEILAAAASARGCDLASVWVTLDGRFHGYILGAPDFVNVEWSSTVGVGIAAQPLLLRCAPPPPGDSRRLSCPAEVNSVVIDYADDFGYVTPELAVEARLQSEDLALPSGTPIEVATSHDRVVWELVAEDGAVVAVLETENVGGNWRVSGATWCA